MLIHVGNMANKGTQALLRCDISLIAKIVLDKVAFAVSTTDVQGVRKLNLPLAAVFPPMVDIPYERADILAKQRRVSRDSWKYKAVALASLMSMPIQMVLSALSAVLLKNGLRPFYRSEFLENLKNSRIIVSYSDENFKEAASMLPMNIYWVLTWWSMLISKMWDILIVKYLGKPLIVFPNSIGPFRTVIGRTLARLALNRCDRILVRDPISYEIVESLGIGVPRVLTVDTALTFDAVKQANEISLRHPVIGVSAGIYSNSLSSSEVEKYIDAHAQALDELIEKRNFTVVFLPHYVLGIGFDDLEVSKEILGHMRNKDAASIVNASSVDEFKSLLSQMDIVVSSKMHPAVLAVPSRVPVVCIAYDHKQVGFFDRLELSDCVLPVHDVSARNLLSKIEHVWKRREFIRSNLEVSVPKLQMKVEVTAAEALSPFVQVKKI